MIESERLGETLNKALQIFGREKQQIKTCEELGELQAEIFKILKGKGSFENLTEEIADVLICIEYIKKIHCIGEREIELMLEKKIERLICIIEEEERKRNPEPEY